MAAAHRDVVVLDSSALVTVLIEPGMAGRRIAARLSGTAPAAPHILPFEVANVLRRRRNAGLLSEAEATLALGGFARMPIELWPFSVLADATRRHGHNLSSYDAAYVALAERLERPLLTRDAKLAHAPGITCPVELFE